MPPKNPPKLTKKLRSEIALEDDWDALDSFCEAIEFEDISFDQWSKTHHTLNLIFELRLSAMDCRDGCEKQITFTRSTYAQCASQRPSKQKITHTIVVPPGTSFGDLIVVKGLGDCKSDQTGDLQVVICP